MSSRVNNLRTLLVEKFKQALPELCDCYPIAGRFDLDYLEANSIRTPAVLPAILKCEGKKRANGQVDVIANCAAFIITQGRESVRDDAAWVIGEALTPILANTNHWAKNINNTDNIEIEPLLSGDINRRGVTIIAVTFSVDVKFLGENLFQDDGTVYTQLYVNDALEVDESGASHG